MARTVGSPQTEMSCLRACASGDIKKSAKTMAAAGALALNGIATKCVLPSVPPEKTKLLTVSGSSPLAIARRCVGRVERKGDVDLAVGEEVAQAAIIPGEGAAASPKIRVRGIEPGEERRRGRLEGGVGRRLLQDSWVRRQVDEKLLQEGRADEIGRLRIGEAAGILRNPFAEGGGGERRLVEPGGIVEEDQPRHAPGRLQAVDRLGEVAAQSSACSRRRRSGSSAVLWPRRRAAAGRAASWRQNSRR